MQRLKIVSRKMKIAITILLLLVSIRFLGQDVVNDTTTNSLNDSISIEINATFHPIRKNARVSIKFDGKNWKSTKCDSTFMQDAETITLVPKTSLEEFNQRLKLNDVFLLPNQFDIPGVKKIVDDGVHYRVTFNIGNRTGWYLFDNPDEYIKAFPQIDTFQKYKKIADRFSMSFMNCECGAVMRHALVTAQISNFK